MFAIFWSEGSKVMMILLMEDRSDRKELPEKPFSSNGKTFHSNRFLETLIETYQREPFI